jgi:glycosyltransferase involved in cell wall biosynthesis
MATFLDVLKGSGTKNSPRRRREHHTHRPIRLGPLGAPATMTDEEPIARDGGSPHPADPAGSADPRVTLLQVSSVPVTLRNFMLPYARHFRSRGWRVDAAAAGAPENAELIEAFDAVHDVSFSRSVRDVRRLVRGDRDIERVIREVAPDIVHVHTPIAAFITRLAVRRMPAHERPLVVYTAHGFHFYEGGHLIANLAFRTAEQVAGRWTDRLVVMNDDDEDAALTHRLVSRQRLVRMRGIGVDTSYYAPQVLTPAEAAANLDLLGLPAGARFFAVVAELRPRKRNADIIRALAAAEHREAYVVFAGEGPLQSDLESLADRLGIRDRVRFLGFVGDVRPVLRPAVASVLASVREGLPRSIMESLAVGTPVIGTAAKGVAELLEPDCGIVVPKGDVGALSRAMDWILDHPQEAEAMGERGRGRMRGPYELQALIAEHERLYAELLAERRDRPVGEPT